MAKTLGTPLLPWQQYVADVASERRPDGSYEYQVIVVTVPRQTGKTTLIRAMATHSALVLGRDVFYTAQTGKDARARWMDLVKILRVTKAFAGRFKVALRGGSEHVDFGGAVFQVFAPGPESLHGYTPPKVIIDEAFAQSQAAGELLMGAIGPAQLTIRDKQVWLVSTMGTADSTFFHDWIDRARDGVPRVALFDWGAGEDDDPYTAEGIAGFHPGVGFELNGKVLEPEDVLGEVEKNTRAEYERAYANRRTITASSVIPVDKWRELAIAGLPAPVDVADLVLSYDVQADRESSTILATWRHGDRIVGKVVRHEPGTAWLADAVTDLRKRWRPLAVAAVNNGPVLDVTAQLQARGEDVQLLNERDYAAASGAFLSLFRDGVLGHDDDRLVMEPSVTGLVPRGAVADGFAFSRRHSVGDSSAGVAFVAGAWTIRRDDLAGKPVTYFRAS